MATIHYEVTRHDGGWAYKVGDVYSDTFPTHERRACRGARRLGSSRKSRGRPPAFATRMQTANGTTRWRRVTNARRPSSTTRPRGADKRSEHSWTPARRRAFVGRGGSVRSARRLSGIIANQGVQTLAIGGVDEGVAGPLDLGVRDPLVVAVEAARHRRQFGCLEGRLRRRLDAGQPRRMGDDILGWRGFVVCDVEHPARAFLGKQRQDAGNIVHMDAVEHLARLDEPLCRSARQIDEAIAARTVDARQAQDRERQAPRFGKPRPSILGRHTSPGALGNGIGGRRLVDPLTAMIAIDADRRQIADPLKIGAAVFYQATETLQDRIAFRCALAPPTLAPSGCLVTGGDRDEKVRRVLKRRLDTFAGNALRRTGKVAIPHSRSGAAFSSAAHRYPGDAFGIEGRYVVSRRIAVTENEELHEDVCPGFDQEEASSSPALPYRADMAS